MVKLFWLFLRPVERFLAQWISVSTEPSAFVRDYIRLGDTTNFIRACKFFLSAIGAAFLAEVATLYLLGIEGLTTCLDAHKLSVDASSERHHCFAPPLWQLHHQVSIKICCAFKIIVMPNGGHEYQ